MDIQPIATQIAKLSFFISLAIEQEPSSDAGNNYGIEPLPNLETRFVAADTLLGLARPAQMPLGQTDAVKELQRELDRNRESHFHANTRQQKQAYRREDSRLRKELSYALRETNFSVGDANKIAAWDPYDQNAHADWFDSEYMSGTPEGFDVVIGNPPYIQLQKDGGRLGTLDKDAGYVTFARTGDIYQLFQERGCQLLKAGQGILTYITSNSWLKAEYGKKTRQYLAEQHTPFVLLELGKDVFEAIVDASVLLLRQGTGNSQKQEAIRAVDIDHLDDSDFPPSAGQWGRARPNSDAPWGILSATEHSVMDKMLTVGTPLKGWDIAVYRGITTGLNEAFIINNRTKEALVAKDPKSAEIIKPVVRGRDIRRYQAAWAGFWLIDTHNGYDADTPAIDVSHYLAVKAYLDNHYEQLAKRYDKGRTP